LKVKDSQLQKIRQLYKNITQEKKVGQDFDGKLKGDGTAATGGVAPKAPANEAAQQTNFGDLHQAVERRRYEFAARAVADAPDVRADRVADIEARIKAGTYRVDPEAVAEAMLNAGLFDDL